MLIVRAQNGVLKNPGDVGEVVRGQGSGTRRCFLAIIGRERQVFKKAGKLTGEAGSPCAAGVVTQTCVRLDVK